jgi:hypothetical protein
MHRSRRRSRPGPGARLDGTWQAACAAVHGKASVAAISDRVLTAFNIWARAAEPNLNSRLRFATVQVAPGHAGASAAEATRRDVRRSARYVSAETFCRLQPPLAPRTARSPADPHRSPTVGPPQTHRRPTADPPSAHRRPAVGPPRRARPPAGPPPARLPYRIARPPLAAVQPDDRHNPLGRPTPHRPPGPPPRAHRMMARCAATALSPPAECDARAMITEP